MKFLTTLGFFASAMALTTPLVKKCNNKQDDLYDVLVATPGRELEAMSLHKRTRGQTTIATVHIPLNEQAASVIIGGITIGFTLSRTRQYAFSGQGEKLGRLCTQLMFTNPTSINLIINILNSSGHVLWRNLLLGMGRSITVKDMQPFSGEDVQILITEA